MGLNLGLGVACRLGGSSRRYTDGDTSGITRRYTLERTHERKASPVSSKGDKISTTQGTTESFRGKKHQAVKGVGPITMSGIYLCTTEEDEGRGDQSLGVTSLNQGGWGSS